MVENTEENNQFSLNEQFDTSHIEGPVKERIVSKMTGLDSTQQLFIRDQHLESKNLTEDSNKSKMISVLSNADGLNSQTMLPTLY